MPRRIAGCSAALLLLATLVFPAANAAEWLPARLSASIQSAVAQTPHQVLDLIVVLKSQPAAEVLAEQNAAFTFERESLERRRATAAANAAETAALAEAQDALTLRIRRATSSRLLALTQPDYDQAAASAVALGATVLERYTALNAFHLRLSAHAIPALLAHPAVADIFPNSAQSAQLDVSVPALGAPTFWQARHTGSGSNVAIFDTGIDSTHPALSPATWTRKVFLSGNSTCVAPDSASSVDDFHGHGTHIAGVILSRGGSSGLDASRLGVAPDLSFAHSYKVSCLNSSGGSTVFDSDVLAALNDLVANTSVRIVNFSFGEPTIEDYPPSARMWDYFADVFDLTVSFPAGNLPSGAPNCRVMSPGVAFNALTVGNWSSRGVMSSTSCPGMTTSGRRKPDLAAPGVSINSTLFNWESGPDFGPASGSSLAAAHIAGAFPLIGDVQGYGSLRARALLINSTDNAGWMSDRGWGYANLQRAFTQRTPVVDNITWPSPLHANARFYKADLSAPAKATLVWNNAVSGSASGPFNNSGLSTLELYAYSSANVPIGTAEGGPLDNVRQISTTAIGPAIFTITSTSQTPPAVRTVETFAFASSVTLSGAYGPILSLYCDPPPPFVLAGSTFTFSCSLTNIGDLTAYAAIATIHWPAGFSAATNSINYGAVVGGTSTPMQSWGTVTFPNTPGRYEIRRTVESASYGANLYFVQPSVTVGVVAAETSPAPVIAALPASASPGSPVDASAGAGFTNLGHTVHYQFDWGDGTLSSWGSFSAYHSFAAPGVYAVRARTRCATDTAVVSEYSAPRTITVSAVQLPTLPNPGFESGSLGSWLTFGSVSPTVTNAAAYSGSYGLATSSGSGGVYVDFDGLTPQRFYHFTVRVKASGAAHEGMFWAHDGLGSDGVYSGWRTFSTSQWEQLQINFRATQSGMARLHLETRGATGGLLWDDVQVTPGWISDMENGTVSPWIPFGAVTAAPASSPANGLYSLALTGSGGAFYDAVGLVPGRWYHVKARVRVAAPTAVRLWLHDTQGANSLTDGWYNLSPGAWNELQLNYQANPMAAMRIHIQANTAGVATYWDDVQVLDGWRSDFDGRSGASGWIQSGAISTTSCPSPLGLSCLAQTGAAGEHYFEFSGLRPSHLYQVRARLRIEAGGSPTAQFSIRDSSNYSLHYTPWYSSPLPWRTHQHSFPAPADGIIRIYLSKGGPDGIVSWDEVELLDGWKSDFEDGLTTHWSTYGQGNRSIWSSPDGSNKALYVNVPSFPGGASRTVLPLLPLNPGLIPGQRYHVSARVRPESYSPYSQATLRALGISGLPPDSSATLAPPLANQWTMLDLNFAADSSGYMQIRLDSAFASGLLWDDVQVKEGWLSDFESLSTTPPSSLPWIPFGSNTSQPVSSPAIGNLSLAQYGGGGGVYLDVPNLTPGRRYQISARARSSIGATAQASLWVHDTAGANASFAVVRTPSPYNWERFTLNFTATSTGKVRIHLVSNGGPTSGDIYWDEVRLSEGWTSDLDNGQIYGWNSYGASAQALSTAAAIGPISLSQTAGNGGSWQDVNGLIPGQDYLIVARSRSSQGATNQSILWVHDTTGANQIWSVGSTPSPYGWDERRLFYRANSTGAVRLHLANTGGNGTLYWDDVEVVPVY